MSKNDAPVLVGASVNGAEERSERAPMLQNMIDPRQAMQNQPLAHMEDTPAYRTLRDAGLLTTAYRKQSFEEIFEGDDLKASSSKQNDLQTRCLYGYYCCPVLGCILYKSTHLEMFVPAGHVGLLMDERQRYLFAQPGMHNINSVFMKHVGTPALPHNGQLQHGNRTILVVEQGYIGIAMDNGQPFLFPPGIHVWTSETLQYQKSVSLDNHNIQLGPYTLLTVDEGYAAVTQNNGKQQILEGGYTHLLNHKNWRFEKFMTLKIQTDDLEKIEATSADNITMKVTSTVTWRIVDPTLAATMAAETMAVSKDKTVSSDVAKLRVDVLKQAIASLSMFIGGVNYSDSFHMAAKVQGGRAASAGNNCHSGGGPSAENSHAPLGASLKEPEEEKGMENPLYDAARMGDAVEHANQTTRSYGVQIGSINILSAVPTDTQLTKALASGAVASAEALQAETAARGNAKAMRIEAEAKADQSRIEAEGFAQAAVIKARSEGEAARLVAEGNKQAADLLSTSQVAVDLAKMEKSAQMLNPSDKFFFGQEPAYLANLVLKGGSAAMRAAM